MDLLLEYFPELNENQKNRFQQLQGLYFQWNQRVNVISRKDIDFLYERHILHSLAIAKFTRFVPGTIIMDAGTGGGFPGIPLAIFFPGVSFVLVDSIGKKIKVVREIIKVLKLDNARAVKARAEDIHDKFHFITGRAVTAMDTFTGYVKNNISRENMNEIKNGILYLKGGDISEDKSRFGKKLQVIELQQYFNREFFETKKLLYLT
ncbi:MAG: 16S rRNA (guanine(527)-N(7))-methyltransferase RsmG [Bacteroidales bacterium]